MLSTKYLKTWCNKIESVMLQNSNTKQTNKYFCLLKPM